MVDQAALSRDDVWALRAQVTEKLAEALREMSPPAEYREQHQQIVAAVLDSAARAREIDELQPAESGRKFDLIIELGEADQEVDRLVNALR